MCHNNKRHIYSLKDVAFDKKQLIIKVSIFWIKFSNKIYKITFIVGHNNKCNIYRSVSGSAIYIIVF